MIIDNYKGNNPLLLDFRNFLYVIWKHLGLPEPTPVQYEIASYLQHGPRRKIIEGYRGVGKSWITSAYVLWRGARDPEYKVLVVSASKQRSDDFSSFTKRLIREVPMLQHLQAREDQRDSMIAFDFGPAKPAHAPSVKSVGIFGQLTGSRAVEIIADDVEVPNNSATQDMRDKLLKACMEFEAIIVPEVGQITYLGTPQTEESIYNKLRERGYDCKIWPARYPNSKQVLAYNGALAESIQIQLEKDPNLVGKPVDPTRFSDLDLREREIAYGRAGFALQFMLDTSLSDAERYPLKLSDLIIFNTDIDKAPISIQWSNSEPIKEFHSIGFTGDRFYRPLRFDSEWAEYEGSILAIDPSGRGQDETTYAVVKQLHGFLYVTALGGLKGGYDEATLVSLAKIAREQKVNGILIESNFGDGMFTKLFQPILNRYWPCSIEEVRHHTQKELRIIDTLEPVMMRHRLIIDYDVVKRDLQEALGDNDRLQYSLFYQMTRITRDRGALKFDDRLDVLAMAVRYWVDSMARDEKLAEEDYRENLLNQELKVFMDHVIGGKNTSNAFSKDFRRRF